MNTIVNPITKLSVGSAKPRVDAVIDKAIADRRIVGTVVIAADASGGIYRRAAGFADREAKRAMTSDSIFLFASLSKPIVAATALAMIDHGVFGLDDAVTRWLPDFRPKLADGSAPTIKLRHLLTHTSGLGYTLFQPVDGPYVSLGVSDGLDQPGVTLEENLPRLAKAPLFFAPGQGWGYSMAIDVLGWVIARAHDATLGDAVAHYVTGPLGMRDTGFALRDPARLATPYVDGSPEPARMADPHVLDVGMPGRLYFSPRRITDPNSYHSGGAGMAGTAEDFIKFLDALRKGGAPILKPETMATASRNQIGDLPRDPKDAGRRFGFLSGLIADPVAAQTPQSAGTLQWGGVYGHTWFIDPLAGLSVVSLTNTVPEGLFGRFPVDVRDAVYGRGAP